MRWRNLTEHQEQAKVIEWCLAVKQSLPEASYIFAIPNGGLRPHRMAAGLGGFIRYSPIGRRLRREGVRPGIPDLFLPVPRLEFHGLFLEMKRLNGHPDMNQLLWKGILTSKGYAVCICRGADQAIDAIKGYLTDPRWAPARVNRRSARREHAQADRC